MSEVREKLCYQELLDKFNKSAEQWLKETPEARSLILVVDWITGSQDFPPGSMISKSLNERSVLESMKQTLKMVNQLSNNFAQQVQSAESILNKAEQIIKASQPKDG